MYIKGANNKTYFFSDGEDRSLNIFNEDGYMVHAEEGITIKDPGGIMRSNLIPPSNARSKNRHTTFSRWGIIDPYSRQNVLKEFVFFTKPDLRIFKNNNSDLVDELANIPFFVDMRNRYVETLWQLQQTYCPHKSPFMNLLTNTVTSKLDLPEISAESSNTTSNIMGYNISLRGHSLKSDAGYDFNLSFNDYGSMEVYYLVKAYDTYMRLIQTGEVAPFRVYSENNILFDQFSAYKFLIGDDGETILYLAKLTGIYFSNVPRGDFSDPSELGKCSLSFHGQFVEDSTPEIIIDFKRILPSVINGREEANIYNAKDGNVNNTMVYMPYVEIARANMGDVRAMKKATLNTSNSYYEYRLKWKK